MSTNSVIAVQGATGDGWRGRYCHSSGEPHYTGVQLLTIVRRDGFDTAIKQLTVDHRAWSYLDAGRPAGASAARGYDNDEDFVSVPGYGTENVRKDPGEDGWTTDTGHDWGTEWAYVLDRRGISVLARWDVVGPTWVEAGYVHLTDGGGRYAMENIEGRQNRIARAYYAEREIEAKNAPAGAPPLRWPTDQLTTTLGRLHRYEKAGRHTAVQILLTLIKDHGCTLTADEIDAVVGQLDPVVGN